MRRGRAAMAVVVEVFLKIGDDWVRLSQVCSAEIHLWERLWREIVCVCVGGGVSLSSCSVWVWICIS